MPKYDELYPRKEPHLQIKILKSIGLRGRLSQKEAAEEFRYKPSTISEAFKIMINRTRLIQIIEPLPDVEGQSKRERFYKLSTLGLLTFIKKNPSPYEFWVAMIWYCMTLNPESADRDEFNQYYNLFIEKFIGEFTLRNCFFLGNLFEKLFQRWREQFGYNPNYYAYGLFPYHRSTYYMQKKKKIRNETRRAYVVLECLLLNRGITIDKIIELTKL
jgi:DNA-binding MarR family transcriptional regulator